MRRLLLIAALLGVGFVGSGCIVVDHDHDHHRGHGHRHHRHHDHHRHYDWR